VPPKPWLRIDIGDGPPDVATRPVKLTIRRGRDVVVDVERRDQSPLTRYVRVPAGQRTALELAVSRTWRPSDFGGYDRRAQGVAIGKWTFVDSPPPDAQTAN